MAEPVAVSYCVCYPEYCCSINQVVADRTEVHLFFRAHGEGAYPVQDPRRSILKQNNSEESPVAIELSVDEFDTKQGMLRYPRRGDYGYFTYGVSGYTPVRISFGTPLEPQLHADLSSRPAPTQSSVDSSLAHGAAQSLADSLESGPAAAHIDNVVGRRSQDNGLPSRANQSIHEDVNRVLTEARRGLAELNASIRVSDALLAVGNSDDDNRESNNSVDTTQTRSILDLRDQIFNLTGAYPPRNLDEVNDFVQQVYRSVGADVDADIRNVDDDASEFEPEDNGETSSLGPTVPEAWANLPAEIRAAIFQTAASDGDTVAALRQHVRAPAAPPANWSIPPESLPTNDNTSGEPASPPLIHAETQQLAPPRGSVQRNCIICFVRPMEMTFVHGNTGHTACCVQCAAELERRQWRRVCPVCRTPYTALIRNFSA